MLMTLLAAVLISQSCDTGMPTRGAPRVLYRDVNVGEENNANIPWRDAVEDNVNWKDPVNGNEFIDSKKLEYLQLAGEAYIERYGESWPTIQYHFGSSGGAAGWHNVKRQPVTFCVKCMPTRSSLMLTYNKYVPGNKQRCACWVCTNKNTVVLTDNSKTMALGIRANQGRVVYINGCYYYEYLMRRDISRNECIALIMEANDKPVSPDSRKLLNSEAFLESFMDTRPDKRHRYYVYCDKVYKPITKNMFDSLLRLQMKVNGYG